MRYLLVCMTICMIWAPDSMARESDPLVEILRGLAGVKSHKYRDRNLTQCQREQIQILNAVQEEIYRLKNKIVDLEKGINRAKDQIYLRKYR